MLSLAFIKQFAQLNRLPGTGPLCSFGQNDGTSPNKCDVVILYSHSAFLVGRPW